MKPTLLTRGVYVCVVISALLVSARIADATPILAPALSISFSPEEVLPGGSTTKSFTLINPNVSTTLTQITVIDTLPAGLTIDSFNVGSCTGGLLVSGPTLAFTGGSLGALGACGFTAHVVASTSLLPGTTLTNSATVSSLETLTSGDSTPSSATLRVVSETGPQPVPEPSTLSMLGLGGIGFLMQRRRQKN